MKGFASVHGAFRRHCHRAADGHRDAINPGNAGSKEMFRVANSRRCAFSSTFRRRLWRRFSNRAIRILRVQELPGEVFPARVTNISNSLDSNSRAMPVILESESGARLYPGM